MRSNDPYLAQIGRKIQDIRKERGLTVRELGEMCEIDYSSLSRIEGGYYSSRILTLKNIADQLKVDVKDLLT